MFKLNINILVFFLSLLISPSAISQSLKGLQEIVSSQQAKIVTIEGTLKELIGSIEEQSKSTSLNQNNKIIQSQINTVNESIKLLQNRITNITNLAFDLDFSLKRIERHLELSSINKKIQSQVKNNEITKKSNYQKNEQIRIDKKSLNSKTNGVLGFIKETSNQDKQNKSMNKENKKNDQNAASLLPKGSVEDQYKFAEDVALSGDYIKAEKVLKEFLIIHKGNKKIADAQFMLGRVYYNQGIYQEATFELVKFNGDFPSDPRFQKSTLLIAEAVTNFADKKQACDILMQTLEFTQNPTKKFSTKLNFLINEKQCNAE